MGAKVCLILLTILTLGLTLGLARPEARPPLLGGPPIAAAAGPVTTHPRLWIRQEDLSRLRSWAAPSNPMYENGLKLLAQSYKTRMDNGTLLANDTGCSQCYTQYPVEWHAELFAFLSLIEATQTARDDYGKRARTLLMTIIDKAALGPAAGQPWRDPPFSTNARSLYHGESFALTYDWAYPYFTPEDKAKIRTVFLRWINENMTATTSGQDHPEPVYLVNDPALLANKKRLRNATNNFFLAHMNQIGLMSLVFDEADDPGDPNNPTDQVRDFFKYAVGAWLYTFDYVADHDAAGGLPAEGFFYGPTGAGRAAEFLLAVYTSGNMDPAVWGQQVTIAGKPHWENVIAGFLHSLAPKRLLIPGSEYLGPSFYAASYGDAQDAYVKESMTLFGTLGLYFQHTGDSAKLNAVRWIQKHVAPGGPSKLVNRANDYNYSRDSILYFLLFDPAAAEPTDPRPALAKQFYAPGLGRALARTDWTENATFVSYMLSWNAIDHQHGNGNAFEFFRKGEWLTKDWAGYGVWAGNSDFKNTMAIENDKPVSSVSFWTDNWSVGSQFAYGPGGDPEVLATSLGPTYVYAMGNAKNLYNNVSGNAMDVKDATRSFFWLQPDTIVVYDRVETGTSNRYKRFWLNAPTLPAISGNRATVTTVSGQKLVVDALLPPTAVLSTSSSVPNGSGYNETANGELMKHRLKIEAPGGPAKTRFLTVLQGVDSGVSPSGSELVESTAGTPFAGTVISNTAILFPVDVGGFAGTTVIVPGTTSVVYVTGLTPGANYGVTVTLAAGGKQVVVSPGGTGYQADSGGVVVVGAPSNGNPEPTPPPAAPTPPPVGTPTSGYRVAAPAAMRERQ